jgi:glutamyl-tRNA synthetase
MLSDGAYLISRPLNYDKETILKKWKSETFELISEWLEELKKISAFTAQNIEETFKAFLEAKQIGIGAVLQPFRLCVTGVAAGPGMFDISEFLGKNEVISRIEIGLNEIRKIVDEA